MISQKLLKFFPKIWWRFQIFLKELQKNYWIIRINSRKILLVKEYQRLYETAFALVVQTHTNQRQLSYVLRTLHTDPLVVGTHGPYSKQTAHWWSGLKPTSDKKIRIMELLYIYITNNNKIIGTRQEQTSYQRKGKIRTFLKDSYQIQDKIQIHRQEIIHHYKNTRIPLCQRSTALTSPNEVLCFLLQLLLFLHRFSLIFRSFFS